jgi:hypothetical protein
MLKTDRYFASPAQTERVGRSRAPMFSSRIRLCCNTEHDFNGLRQRVRLAVRHTHPPIHWTKSISTISRRMRMAFPARLDCLLVLPPRNATLSSRRALSLDWVRVTRLGPIAIESVQVSVDHANGIALLNSRFAAYW